MNSEHPPARPLQSTDAILFLIAQELKLRKLFDGLEKAGLEECCYQPHLDRIILAEIGLDDGKDETMEWYCGIIEKGSKKMNRTQASINKQSLKVYLELTAEKTKRTNLQ